MSKLVGCKQALPFAVFSATTEELAIRIMVESLGSWDYELEVVDNRGIEQLTGRFYEAFSRYIVPISVISMFQHLKYSGFPFDT